MTASIARIALAISVLLVPQAARGQEAYFSMGRLQAQSRLFGEVSAASQKNNERVQREVVSTGQALDELGDALVTARAVTGQAPQLLEGRRTALADQFDADWSALNEFVDRLVTDTDRAFTEALARHVTTIEEREGVALATCEPPQGVLGMAMGQSDCAGKDYTDWLVESIDADPELAEAVQDVSSREWPSVRADRVPMAPVAIADGAQLDDATPAFSLQAVFRGCEAFEGVVLALEGAYRSASRDLQRAQEAHEANRYMFAEALETLSAEEQQARATELDADLQSLRAASEQLTQWRTRTTAGALQLIWEQLAERETAALKAVGVDTLGVCLQPTDLGGCTGPGVSNDLATYLADQKKVLKAAEKFAESIDAPALDL